MSEKILVTYASRTGTTAEVAEAIGHILSEGNDRIDVLPMTEVSDLTPYRAVIAGSAIQAAQWLPEAQQFIKTHQADLSGKTFAIFTVCMTMAMPNGGKYRNIVAEWLEPVRRLVRPVDEAYFAGSLDIAKVQGFGNRIKFRLSVLLGVWKTGDHRNWDAIRSWANKQQIILDV